MAVQYGKDQRTRTAWTLSRTKHAKITECLKASNVEDMYLLAGIAPPDIRRKVCTSVEMKKQEANKAHSLFRQKSAEKRLQSRNCFLSFVHHAELPAKVVRCSEWQKRLKDQPQYKPVLIDENLAIGHTSNTYRKNMQQTANKMGLLQRTTCECGLSPTDTKHMLQCPLLAQPCSLDDLLVFNGIANNCLEYWKHRV